MKLMQAPKLIRYTTARFARAQVRVSKDGRFSLLDVLKALGLEDMAAVESVLTAQNLEVTRYDFGGGPEPTVRGQQIALLAFALETPEARQWRRRAQEMLGRYFEGDIQLAAEIAERNPEPQTRRWLAARLESIEARKNLMSVVAKHGGQGPVYGQLGSLSNQSVLKMNSVELRRQRGVKSTRDGLTALELKRLSYLETATAKAIEERKIKGNQEILELHRRNAEAEKKVWETAGDKVS
ncbi:MAG: DNA damage response protein DdrC [Meiothermus sp.]|nr:DNA damage response protein DdrC [Meiothermus sp.]